MQNCWDFKKYPEQLGDMYRTYFYVRFTNRNWKTQNFQGEILPNFQNKNWPIVLLSELYFQRLLIKLVLYSLRADLFNLHVLISKLHLSCKLRYIVIQKVYSLLSFELALFFIKKKTKQSKIKTNRYMLFVIVFFFKYSQRNMPKLTYV